MHQLLVRLDAARRDVQAVQVGDVAVAVDVARLPDILAVRIDERHVHPELRLRTERARRQVVPRIGVLDLVGERQIRTDLRCARRCRGPSMWLLFSRTDLRISSRSSSFFEILVDDLACVFTVDAHQPTVWESRL